MPMEAIKQMKVLPITMMRMRMVLKCVLGLFGHAGSFKSGMPPQRSLFPVSETAVILSNTPPFGISPWRWLNERGQFPQTIVSTLKRGYW